jgi:cell division control protein 6
MDKINQIFEAFVNYNLFKDKRVLQSNYAPENIPHRDAQVEAVASILAPALRCEKISNLFVYGKTGTGKTLSIQHVGNKILDKIKELGQNNVKFVYVNCKLKKVADTEYRILA